jgi:ketosteroid isomerase-like protein
MSALETVQTIYTAFGRGDVPAILQRISPDVSWEHGALDHGIPWLVPGRGLTHVGAFFETVGRELDITRFEVQQLYAAGDQVIAQIAIELVVRSTGKPVRDLELHHWQLGADGLVHAFRHVVDTHQHWAASR